MRKLLGVLAVALGAVIVWLIAMDRFNAIDLAIGAVFGAIVCELVHRDDGED